MTVLYYYIPNEKVEDVVECGLKLSEWKSRMQATPSSLRERPCLVALLHPLDDKRHRDASFRCIKLNIPKDDVLVADSDLYYLGQKHPKIKVNYFDSMIPLKDYAFGTFRKPECPVFSTILPEQISLLGKGLDEPLLYENSETLYANNQLEKYNNRYHDVNQVLLYSFLSLQEQNACLKGFRNNDMGLAGFFDKEMKHYITVPIPGFKKYRLDLAEEDTPSF